MNPVIHNYNHLAGKTVYWDTSDREDLFEKNCKDPQKYKILQQNEFIDRPVSYQFNSHGFRTKEFDQPADIVCFGCSFTMGTGVHEADTWPSQLALASGTNVYNLGHAGSSNDTAFRFALHYLPWLKPKFAIWLQADAHRIELLDDYIPNSQNFLAAESQLATRNDYFLKAWFSSASNHDVNLTKNTMAFKYLCHEFDIIPIVISRSLVCNDHSARDLEHPGAKSYRALANHVQDQIVSQRRVESQIQ